MIKYIILNYYNNLNYNNLKSIFLLIIKNNNLFMLEELYAQIKEQFEIVEERHAKFVEKGNKSAEADVRKALGEIKKLITPYRQASVEATKK